MKAKKKSNNSSAGNPEEFSVKGGKCAKKSLEKKDMEKKDIGADVKEQCNLTKNKSKEFSVKVGKSAKKSLEKKDMEKKDIGADVKEQCNLTQNKSKEFSVKGGKCAKKSFEKKDMEKKDIGADVKEQCNLTQKKSIEFSVKVGKCAKKPFEKKEMEKKDIGADVKEQCNLTQNKSIEFSVKGGKCAKKDMEKKDSGADVKEQCNLTQEKSVKKETSKRGHKRLADSEYASSTATVKYKRSATNLPKTSETNGDLFCKTTITAPVITGGNVSKGRALQRLREEARQQRVKRGLFEKASDDAVKLKKPRSKRKNKCDLKKEKGKQTCPDVKKQKEEVKKTWQNIPFQSESSLLFTPDPVTLEKRILPESQDPSPNSHRLSYDGNLSKDTCDSSDSDDDLPEVLTPAKHDGRFSRGDLIWAQIRGWPFWPGVVTSVYMKKKKLHKLSVRFINDISSPNKKLKTYPVRLNSHKAVVYQFTDSKRKQFEDEGCQSGDRALIEEAVKKAEDYLTKLGLGLVKTNALNYFFPNSPDLHEPLTDGSDHVEDTEPDSGGIKRLESISSMESEEIIVEPTEEDIPESKTIKARNERRRNRCESLVEFIKSEKMKDYLIQLYYGKRESLLHASYHGSVSEKNKIRNPGFGPINDDDQRTEILDMLVSWANEIPGFKAAYIDYVIDVWLPEAIVYALIIVKHYGRGRAWQLFRKGIRFTKEELAASHIALLEAAERISPQDKIMYKEKLQDRIRRLLAVSDDSNHNLFY